MPNSYDKGSSFEREIARDLSIWVSGGTDKCIFSRRSGSGGSARDKQGLSGSGGDIYSDKIEGRWLTDHTLFELKFYKDLTGDLWNFMANKPSIINEFICQAIESAYPYGRKWTLIIKCNRRETLLLTNSRIIGKQSENKSEINTYNYPIYLYQFRELLATSPANIKQRISEYCA